MRMRATMRCLSMVLGLGGVVILSGANVWGAVGDPISINFEWSGTAVDDMAGAEVAGVVPLPQWNSATLTGNPLAANLANNIYNNIEGNGVSASRAALLGSTGAATGVNALYFGANNQNSPNLSTSAVQNTPDAKMMYSAHGGYRDGVTQGLFTNPSSAGFVFYRSNVGSNGPADNKVRLENLQAQFPNGFQVYVYLNGSGTGSHNEQNNTIAAGQGAQMASPLYTGYGPSGLLNAISSIENGRTQHIGDDPATGPVEGTDQLGIETALPAGATWFTIWPTRFVNGVIPVNATAGTGQNAGADNVTWSSSWDGAYVDGSAGLGQSDNYWVVDYTLTGNSTNDLPRNNTATNNGNGFAFTQPPAENPIHAYIPNAPATLAQTAWHDPTTRGPTALNGGPGGGATPAPGPTIGNYYTFDITPAEFSLFPGDILELFARPVNGERTTTASSAGSGVGVLSFGGMTGIQIVALEDAEVVPEPSTFVLAGLGLVGLVGLAWRRRRR